MAAAATNTSNQFLCDPTDEDAWFVDEKGVNEGEQDFGQRSPMTTTLANIIKDYNSAKIIQELLQNCDDARAKNVAFVLDKRETCTKGGLLAEAMRPFMGPALLQYDDAVFAEKDFKSLQNTADSHKKMDPTSTGKFGLGFNSVYHLTDFPMFVSKEAMCLLEPHERIFRDSRTAPATGTQRRLQVLSEGEPENKKRWHGMLEAFDLGFGEGELHDGYQPLRNKEGQWNVDWPATLFRFPLRTERMQKHSRICEKCGAIFHDVDMVERDIFAPYKEGTNALNRLLFLRCVQSVKLYTWDEHQSKPRLMFSCEIENVKTEARIMEQRKALVTWLKKGMQDQARRSQEQQQQQQQREEQQEEEEEEDFYGFFGRAKLDSHGVPYEDLASKAPRHLIPLVIHTKKRDPNGEYLKPTIDHVLISTGFGTNEDLRAAVTNEVKTFKQCLVPFVAVAAHVAQNGKPVKAEDRESLCFAVLPTPVHVAGLPVHLEGRWELKVDRCNLVELRDATGDSRVRARWNERLLLEVAPVPYARLLQALACPGIFEEEFGIDTWMSYENERINLPPQCFYELFPTDDSNDFWGRLCRPVFEQLFTCRMEDKSLPRVFWGQPLANKEEADSTSILSNSQMQRVTTHDRSSLFSTSSGSTKNPFPSRRDGRYYSIEEVAVAPSHCLEDSSLGLLFEELIASSIVDELPARLTDDANLDDLAKEALDEWGDLARILSRRDRLSLSAAEEELEIAEAKKEEFAAEFNHLLQDGHSTITRQDMHEKLTFKFQPASIRDSNGDSPTQALVAMDRVLLLSQGLPSGKMAMLTHLPSGIKKWIKILYKNGKSKETYKKGDRVMHNGRVATVDYGPDSDRDYKVRYHDDKARSGYLKARDLKVSIADVVFADPGNVRKLYKERPCRRGPHSLLTLAYCLLDKPSKSELDKVCVVQSASVEDVICLGDDKYLDAEGGYGLRLFGHTAATKKETNKQLRVHFIDVRAAAILRRTPNSFARRNNVPIFSPQMLGTFLEEFLPRKWYEVRETNWRDDQDMESKCPFSCKDKWLRCLWDFISTCGNHETILNTLSCWPLLPAADGRMVSHKKKYRLAVESLGVDPGKTDKAYAVGSKVRISNYQSRPDINDTIATVIGDSVDSTGKPEYIVQLNDRDTIELKSIFLIPINKQAKASNRVDNIDLLEKLSMPILDESILPVGEHLPDFMRDYLAENNATGFAKQLISNYLHRSGAQYNVAYYNKPGSFELLKEFAPKILAQLARAAKSGKLSSEDMEKIRYLPLFPLDGSLSSTFVPLRGGGQTNTKEWRRRPEFPTDLDGIDTSGEKFLSEPSSGDVRILYDKLNIKPLQKREFFKAYVLKEDVLKKLNSQELWSVLKSLKKICNPRVESTQDIKKEDFLRIVASQNLFTFFGSDANDANDANVARCRACELRDPREPHNCIFFARKLPSREFWEEEWLDFLLDIGMRGLKNVKDDIPRCASYLSEFAGHRKRERGVVTELANKEITIFAAKPVPFRSWHAYPDMMKDGVPTFCEQVKSTRRKVILDTSKLSGITQRYGIIQSLKMGSQAQMSLLPGADFTSGDEIPFDGTIESLSYQLKPQEPPPPLYSKASSKRPILMPSYSRSSSIRDSRARSTSRARSVSGSSEIRQSFGRESTQFAAPKEPKLIQEFGTEKLDTMIQRECVDKDVKECNLEIITYSIMFPIFRGKVDGDSLNISSSLEARDDDSSDPAKHKCFYFVAGGEEERDPFYFDEAAQVWVQTETGHRQKQDPRRDAVDGETERQLILGSVKDVEAPADSNFLTLSFYFADNTWRCDFQEAFGAAVTINSTESTDVNISSDVKMMHYSSITVLRSIMDAVFVISRDQHAIKSGAERSLLESLKDIELIPDSTEGSRLRLRKARDVALPNIRHLCWMAGVDILDADVLTQVVPSALPQIDSHLVYVLKKLDVRADVDIHTLLENVIQCGKSVQTWIDDLKSLRTVKYSIDTLPPPPPPQSTAYAPSGAKNNWEILRKRRQQFIYNQKIAVLERNKEDYRSACIEIAERLTRDSNSAVQDSLKDALKDIACIIPQKRDPYNTNKNFATVIDDNNADAIQPSISFFYLDLDAVLPYTHNYQADFAPCLHRAVTKFGLNHDVYDLKKADRRRANFDGAGKRAERRALLSERDFYEMRERAANELIDVSGDYLAHFYRFIGVKLAPEHTRDLLPLLKHAETLSKDGNESRALAITRDALVLLATGYLGQKFDQGPFIDTAELEFRLPDKDMKFHFANEMLISGVQRDGLDLSNVHTIHPELINYKIKKFSPVKAMLQKQLRPPIMTTTEAEKSSLDPDDPHGDRFEPQRDFTKSLCTLLDVTHRREFVEVFSELLNSGVEEETRRVSRESLADNLPYELRCFEKLHLKYTMALPNGTEVPVNINRDSGICHLEVEKSSGRYILYIDRRLETRTASLVFEVKEAFQRQLDVTLKRCGREFEKEKGKCFEAMLGCPSIEEMSIVLQEHDLADTFEDKAPKSGQPVSQEQKARLLWKHESPGKNYMNFEHGDYAAYEATKGGILTFVYVEEHEFGGDAVVVDVGKKATEPLDPKSLFPSILTWKRWEAQRLEEVEKLKAYLEEVKQRRDVSSLEIRMKQRRDVSPLEIRKKLESFENLNIDDDTDPHDVDADVDHLTASKLVEELSAIRSNFNDELGTAITDSKSSQQSPASLMEVYDRLKRIDDSEFKPTVENACNYLIVSIQDLLRNHILSEGHDDAVNSLLLQLAKDLLQQEKEKATVAKDILGEELNSKLEGAAQLLLCAINAMDICKRMETVNDDLADLEDLSLTLGGSYGNACKLVETITYGIKRSRELYEGAMNIKGDKTLIQDELKKANAALQESSIKDLRDRIAGAFSLHMEATLKKFEDESLEQNELIKDAQASKKQVERIIELLQPISDTDERVTAMISFHKQMEKAVGILLSERVLRDLRKALKSAPLNPQEIMKHSKTIIDQLADHKAKYNSKEYVELKKAFKALAPLRIKEIDALIGQTQASDQRGLELNALQNALPSLKSKHTMKLEAAEKKLIHHSKVRSLLDAFNPMRGGLESVHIDTFEDAIAEAKIQFTSVSEALKDEASRKQYSQVSEALWEEANTAAQKARDILEALKRERSVEANKRDDATAITRKLENERFRSAEMNLKKQQDKKDRLESDSRIAQRATKTIEDKLKAFKEAGNMDREEQAELELLMKAQKECADRDKEASAQLAAAKLETQRKQEQLKKMRENLARPKSLAEEENDLASLEKVGDSIDDAVGEVVSGIAELDRTIQGCNKMMDQLMQNELKCPALFIMIPLTSSKTYMDAIKSKLDLVHTWRLRFLCAYDLTPLECGPEGDGFDIAISTERMKKLAGAVRFSLYLLRVANVALKFICHVDVLEAVESLGDGKPKNSAGKKEITPEVLFQQEQYWKDASHSGGGAVASYDLEQSLASDETDSPAHEATASAYRTLEHLIIDEREGGGTLVDSCLAIDKDHTAAWVKRTNQKAWEESTASSRRKEMKLKAELEDRRRLEDVDSAQNDQSEPHRSSVEDRIVNEMEEKVRHLKEIERRQDDLNQLKAQQKSRQLVMDGELEQQKKKVEEEKKKLRKIKTALKEAEEMRQLSYNQSHRLSSNENDAEEEKLREEREKEIDALRVQREQLEQFELEKERMKLEKMDKEKKKMEKRRRDVEAKLKGNTDKLKAANLNVLALNSSAHRLLKALTEATKGAQLECPSLFVLVPEQHTCNGSCMPKLKAYYRLIFLCAFDGSPAKCGDGSTGGYNGFRIAKDSDIFEKLQPALHAVLIVARVLFAAQQMVTGLNINKLFQPLLCGHDLKNLFAEATFTEERGEVLRDVAKDTKAPDNEHHEAGKSYGELVRYLKAKHPTFSQSIELRKAIDAEGTIGWVSPENLIHWSNSTMATRHELRLRAPLQKFASELALGNGEAIVRDKFLKEGNSAPTTTQQQHGNAAEQDAIQNESDVMKVFKAHNIRSISDLLNTCSSADVAIDKELPEHLRETFRTKLAKQRKEPDEARY